MPKTIGIFLLSYNRPVFIQEAIHSILAQDYNDFELIISENTPDDSVVKCIHPYLTDPRVRLIKRTPSLTSLEHFNAILKECNKYNYVMLFHDDDILIPTALSKMMQKLESCPTLTAAAANALIIKNTEPTNRLLSPNITKDVKIRSQSELINRYILKSLGHPPFSAYIYRAKFLKNIELDTAHGGKYSDVSFLIKLIKNGPFIWIAEPLINYRQHSNNDSVQINMSDIFSLSLFFLKTSPKMVFKIGFYYFKQLGKKLTSKPMPKKLAIF